MSDLNLVGIDEAGRGALAGSLSIAACKLNSHIKGLNDSKKLTVKAREELFAKIKENSQYLIIHISCEDIDRLGISLCFKKALSIIKSHFNKANLLFDGNTNFGISDIKTMIKADEKIPTVSAASILAKVSRDEFMKTLPHEFEKYHFAKHKGYASKLHLEMIKKYGLSKIHRKSFKLKALEPTLF